MSVDQAQGIYLQVPRRNGRRNHHGEHRSPARSVRCWFVCRVWQPAVRFLCGQIRQGEVSHDTAASALCTGVLLRCDAESDLRYGCTSARRPAAPSGCHHKTKRPPPSMQPWRMPTAWPGLRCYRPSVQSSSSRQRRSSITRSPRRLIPYAPVAWVGIPYSATDTERDLAVARSRPLCRVTAGGC